MKKHLLLFIGLALTYCTSFGQNPFAVQLSRSNGLPSNSVFETFQDSKGFMWFASTAGLTRYDGVEFTTFKCDELTFKAGSCIREDKYGRIWYENFDGNLFYVFNNKLNPLKQLKVLKYIPYGLTNKHLLAIELYGIAVYDLKTLKKIKFIPVKLKKIGHSASTKHNFYYLAENKLHQLDSQLKVTKIVLTSTKTEVARQVFSKNGGIYVFSQFNENKLLYVFNEDLILIKKIKIPEPVFIQNSNFTDNAYWINTPKGTFKYENVKENKITNNYFSKKSISGVITDRQNNYWFTTTNEGVFLVPNLKNKVFYCKEFIPGKIIKNQNNFIVGCKSGVLLSFNANKNTVQKLINNNETLEINYLFNDEAAKSLFYGAGGLNIINNTNYKPQFSFTPSVKEMCLLDEKYYAVAATGFCGLMLNPKANLQKKSIWDRVFESNKTTPNFSYLKNYVRGKTIAYNPQNKAIYFSSNEGFFKSTTQNTIAIKNSNAIFNASKIFVYKNVIYSLNTKGNLYQITNEKYFRKLNAIYGIKEFDVGLLRLFGNLLCFTDGRFIHCLNLDTKKHSLLETAIPASEINDIYLQANELIILTDEAIIKAEVKVQNPLASSTIFYLQWLKANNKNFNLKSKLVFNYLQNDISLGFAVLDFGKLHANKVFYSLNDGPWKKIATDARTLELQALSSGNYNIKFKLDNQLINQKISFKINPPFWLSWWFILLSLLFALLIFVIYYKWRLTIYAKQISLLKEKIQLEKNLGKSILTSIKAQMNPHFFYNALNTIQAYIFTNDKRNASVYLGKFSKLTRIILEMSEKDLMHLEEEIKALTLYLELEKMRFNDDFTFTIQVDESVDLDMTKLPPMLVQPYVENAVHHGLMHKSDNKNVTILFTKEGDFLKVTIEDNGIGRKKSGELNSKRNEKHQSFATEANKKRLEILNSTYTQKLAVQIIDKTDTAKNPLGTIVNLFIPKITI